MAKLNKRAEILNKLHSLVEKEAGAQAQTNVSGKPGVDTDFTSVSEKTETTDKNSVGPEKLNDKQKYEQKPASDEAEPVASAKSASFNIDKLATDLLATISEKMKEGTTKEALAQTDVSGKPGVDTEFTSVSDKTETTDKNSVGPEKLNDKQDYEQKPSNDSAKPVAKTAEELNKEASYKLGASFAEALIKKAAVVKQAEAQQQQAAMIKEAGRRDFEALIQQASLEIKTAKERDALAAKQAEAQGAYMFDQMLKEARLKEAESQVKALSAKLAEYAAFEKEAQARFEAQQREEEFSKLASVVVERLKNELSAAKQ